MIRRLLSPVVVAVLTLFFGIVAILIWPFDRSGRLPLGCARLWSRCILGFAGVRVSVRGRIPPDAVPAVLMANHASNIDIWALLAALPLTFRMISKKEWAYVPVLGWAMLAGRFMFIDRSNHRRARETMNQAAARIRGGESLLIFPEGTRSRTGALQPFKKGGVHLALQAGVPILPIAILGAHAIMPRGRLVIGSGPVTIVIGRPIATEGRSAGDREALLTEARQAVVEMIEAEGADTSAGPKDGEGEHPVAKAEGREPPC